MLIMKLMFTPEKTVKFSIHFSPAYPNTCELKCFFGATQWGLMTVQLVSRKRVKHGNNGQGIFD